MTRPLPSWGSAPDPGPRSPDGLGHAPLDAGQNQPVRRLRTGTEEDS
ncbi:hypothetical protein SAMN05216499_10663 [Actinacidiphila paucisporea]|uniref:Uncharacterized protein n=1 Tax=Actinacidiphila paucisporea TaxID=310782 RepID=A0A1M7DG94_9ACTN|nr:hypothetical protein SAMN05216499_10663 [Actinacidiphila paucisporea]